MSLKLINEALVLLHDIHGSKADQVVTLLRKVRTNFLNEVGTVAAAVKPVVEVAREVVDVVADETVHVLNIVQKEAAASAVDAVDAVDSVDNAPGANKELEPLAKVIARKAKRKPGRPRKT